METLFLVFALGAGVVVASKGGRGVARRALGWSARKAGAISAQASAAIGEARRIAREEFVRERDGHPVTYGSTNGASPAGLSVARNGDLNGTLNGERGAS
jgi:hypothetical protein